jgi:hypothetical protein
MNWKNWKIGLLVSVLSGVFTGALCVAINMTWKQVLFVMVVNIGKDGLLYLQTHPADAISFDTSSVKRTASDGSSVESTVRKTTVTTPVDGTPPKA